MSGLPAGRGNGFEKLMSGRLCVRFILGLHRVTGFFNRSCLQPDLARLGVALAGSACRVSGVNKIGR